MNWPQPNDNPNGRLIDRMNRLNRKLMEKEQQLVVNKTVYSNNIKIVAKERDGAIEKHKMMTHINLQLQEKIIKLENEMKCKEKDRVRLETENRKLRTELSKQYEKTQTMKKKVKAVERPMKTPNISYTKIVHHNSQMIRLDKVLDVIEAHAGEPDSSKFYRDLLSRLNNLNIHKTKFTAHEGFAIYNALRLSRQSYMELKRSFKGKGMMDPFPSLESIKEVENIVAPRTIFEVEQKNVDGKSVVAVYLNDIQSYLTQKVQQLYDSEKLCFDQCTGQNIWLCILGDKGGEETKLSLAIGNVDSPNSCHHLIPVGMYKDEESAKNLRFYLGNAIDQINNIVEVKINTPQGEVTYPVVQYLGGDFKFLCEALAHQGSSATYNCMKCYAPGRVKVSKYVPGKDYEMRTSDSYLRDSQQSSKQARRSVKENEKAVFTRATVENVIPATLHITTGLTEQFGFRVLKRMAEEADMTGIPKQTEKVKKEEELKLERMEVEVERLKEDYETMGTIHEAYRKFLDKKVESTNLSIDNDCTADMCLLKDRSMERKGYCAAQLIQCKCCKEVVHGICGGVWSKESYEDVNSPDFTFLCFTCQEYNRRKVVAVAESHLLHLKNTYEIEKENLRLAIEDHKKRHMIWKGLGSTRKQLEAKWRSLGAITSSYKQCFTGNHTMKLITDSAIDYYCTVLPPSERLNHVKKFLSAMGRFARLCVARELSNQELEEMEDAIKTAFYHIQNSSPNENVPPKLHTLLEHVMPFARKHRTVAKTSEQGVEASHNATNRLKHRYISIVDQKQLYTIVFRTILYQNHLSNLN